MGQIHQYYDVNAPIPTVFYLERIDFRAICWISWARMRDMTLAYWCAVQRRLFGSDSA